MTPEQKRQLNDLWARVRTGDAEALEQLLVWITQTGRPELTDVFRGKRNRPTGRTSEVILRLMERIYEQSRAGKLRSPRFGAWETIVAFMRKVAQELYRFIRMTPKRRPVVASLEDVEQYTRDPRALDACRDLPCVWEHAADVKILLEELARLSPDEREIYRQRMQGLSEKEIALRAGVSHDVVRQRWHRTVVALAEALRRRKSA